MDRRASATEQAARQTVLERIACRPADGADMPALMEEMRALQRLLETTDGFACRTVWREEGGTWLDLVEWTSLDAAQAAEPSILAQPCMTRMMALFDPDSVAMAYRLPVGGIGFERVSGAAGCLEVLTYRLKAVPDSEARCLEAAKRLDTLLQADEACLGRRLFRPDSNGEWLELIWYTSKAEACRLFEQIKEDPAMTDGVRLVDETDMTIRFAEPLPLHA